MSAATATARGATKNTAASSQSVMDPGPACAAAGTQRVPTMQAMAKRGTSLSPISRRSAGAVPVTVIGSAMWIWQFYAERRPRVKTNFGEAQSGPPGIALRTGFLDFLRSEEHTSELQSP